jgi:hypothetical protein
MAVTQGGSRAPENALRGLGEPTCTESRTKLSAFRRELARHALAVRFYQIARDIHRWKKPRGMLPWGHEGHEKILEKSGGGEI